MDVEIFASRRRLWCGVLARYNIIMFSSPTFNKTFRHITQLLDSRGEGGGGVFGPNKLELISLYMYYH